MPIASTRAAPASTAPLFRRKGGGAETGPNPTDRGKAGTKHHIVTDRGGTPLVGLIGPANRHDSLTLEAALDVVPPLKGKRGRPRRRPRKLHADKAYNHRRCRGACRRRHILHRFRRLTVRYERRADIHQAFLTLGCAISATISSTGCVRRS